MSLHLRLICAVTPLAVAGLRFGRGPVRAYGVLVRPLDQFDDIQLREVFAEPRIDVSVGQQVPTGDRAFVPVADQMDLTRVMQLFTQPIGQPEPGANAEPRDTLQVIADHHRTELERGRDAAAPGGDDEGAGAGMTQAELDQAFVASIDPNPGVWALPNPPELLPIHGETISTDTTGAAPSAPAVPPGAAPAAQAPADTAAEGGSSGTSATTRPPRAPRAPRASAEK